MAYIFTMHRDRIVLNQGINDYLKQKVANNAIPGALTVLLAAREMIIPDGFTFELSDCDLVLLADKVSTSTGKIKINVTVPVPDAQPGLPGRNVTIVCQELWGINAELQGGAGGKGLRGAGGTPGADGEEMWKANNGQDGGKGGKGGNGGTGGKGGTLKLHFIEDKVPGGIGGPSTHITLPGGLGGAAGPGGPGGAGGEGKVACKPTNPNQCSEGRNGDTGPPGDPGNAGATGPIGTQTNSQFSSMDQFGQTARSFYPEWLAYRLRVGEYYFRAFNTGSEVAAARLPLAFNEFSAVLAMDPGNAQASTYRVQILNNQNILGLPRDVDIIPDFDRYEEVYTDYVNIINAVFAAAVDMLRDDISFSQKKQDLQREITNAANLIGALELDLRVAEQGKDISKIESDRADQRVQQIKAQIAAKKQELERASVDIFGAIIGTVGLVVSVIAAIPTGGFSLVGAASSFAAIAKNVSETGVLGLIGEALESDPKKRPEYEKLKKDALDLQGYVAKVQTATANIINFTSMLDQAWKAKVDNAGYQKLIVDSIELSHAQLLAQLRDAQAEFTRLAADRRLNQAKISKDEAQKQLDTLTNDLEYLERVAFTLIRMAQYYIDFLIKYAFLAARALEIYTLADLSREIRYDYGYIHPDLESDYEQGFLDLTQLLGYYQTSWRQFAGLIAYRDRYETYFGSGNWVHDLHRISFKDGAILDDFRETPELLFTLRVEDLPSSRFEAKVEAVYVAFIGATSNSGTVSTIVEHSGLYAEKKRDATIVNVALKPRAQVASAKTEPLQNPGGNIGATPRAEGFWGKGVAASWLLRIEQEELDRENVDLSGLTEIQVWIRYQSFLQEWPFTPGFDFVRDGTLMREQSSDDMYVIYGGAKFLIPDEKKLRALELEGSDIDEEVPSLTISAFPSVPQVDVLLQEQGSDELYLVKDGVKFRIADDSPLEKLGLERSEMRVVPEQALRSLPHGGEWQKQKKQKQKRKSQDTVGQRSR